jgi:hypothetical protein
MINSVMINEEKVNKRKSPPSLPRPLHTTQSELLFLILDFGEKGDLSGSTTVLCCRGSGCRSPPTSQPRLVWRGPPPARSLAL